MTRKERGHLVFFRILELIFSTYKLFFSRIFFAQNLKLVRLSNPRKYQIKTLTTAPRRRPVSCTKKRHFRILLGLICIFSKIFLDSVFPIDVIKTSRPIYTVDFDQYRDKVLILDDQELLSIYHIENQGPGSFFYYAQK